jgi:hypothetical protein
MAEAPALKRRSLYRVKLLGSVRSDEVLPAEELRRRLSWGRKTFTRALGDGLRVVRYGRIDYILGVDILAFFVAQSARQSEAGAPGSTGKVADSRPGVAETAGAGGPGA